MRLADAFDIVLGLAILYTKEHPTEKAFMLSRQREAIAEIDKFVRTYDFDDAPDTDD